MASEREKLETADLGALADIIGAKTGLSPFAEAELARRQVVSQQEAAKAQERAADAQEMAAKAAKETARYTQANARYMLLSVVVLTISFVVTAFFSIRDHWR